MEQEPGRATGGATGGATGRATGGATGRATGPQTVTRSQGRVTEESDGDSTARHLHHFQVKFSPTDTKEYTINCDQHCTVLEAIKSIEKYKEKMKYSDENTVIQLGKEDKECIIPTHFPCSCVKEGQSLILSYESKKVEAVQDQQDKTIQPRDKYSVFYIDTVGGLYTLTKKLFRNNAVKRFKYLCVYGEKGMTVEEALKRDGRFDDYCSSFYLSDNDNPSHRIESRQKVDNLGGKKFKICFPWGVKPNDEMPQEKPGASESPPQKQEGGIKPLDNVVKQRGISVRAAMEERDSKVSDEEIYEELRQQFPKLKEWMESRFPADSYQKALDLKKEDFGKIQRLFSEVHRVRKMIKLGESVCKVVVENGPTGTGFVLFDNYILTNAHILRGCVEGEKLKPGIDVDVFFNYDDPEPHMNYCCFQAHRVICYREGELDYAILRLNLESQKQSTQTNEMKVPPGLLKRFGKLPTTGEACLIGHPAGQVKKIDPTCIIEKENREQTVDDHPYKDKRFVVHLINELKEQGIESIMMGGNQADKVPTYDTFMYHGASGSPVFDAHGNVFGLHTAGFVYGQPFHTESVIEYAQPVLTIFEDFVSMMKGRENVQSLLKRVREVAKGNSELEEVLESVLKGSRYEALLRSSPPLPCSLSSPAPSSFNFALFNIQSLNNKALEVHDLLLHNPLDFLLLIETWQKPNDDSPLNRASPPNFGYLCKPRPYGRGGALAVLFNQNLRTTELTFPTAPTVTSFEYLAFKTCSTTVILIYRPPPKPNPSFLSELSELLTLASSPPSPLLLLGDFNIHMDCPTCKHVSDFSNLLDNFNLTQHVTFPTHNDGHILDLVCSANVTVQNIHPSPYLLSDHTLIQFTILSPTPRPQQGIPFHDTESIDPLSDQLNTALHFT